MNTREKRGRGKEMIMMEPPNVNSPEHTPITYPTPTTRSRTTLYIAQEQ